MAVQAGAGLVVGLQEVGACALGKGAVGRVGRTLVAVVHGMAAFAVCDTAGMEREAGGVEAEDHSNCSDKKKV